MNAIIIQHSDITKNMPRELLDIQVKNCQTLSDDEYSEILALCTQAFKRDYSPIYKTFQDPTHILGRYSGQLVTHALWVTRWLKTGTPRPMRTAFVEAVATEISYRNLGYATELMKALAVEIKDFDFAALATGSQGFYARLGWRSWRGPLFIRTDQGVLPTPNEHGIMILTLPRTPPIDLDSQLSAEWREGDLW
jgi:aminoglycoside 2'-N-acetyltransferase I